jgi:hypothetical protein
MEAEVVIKAIYDYRLLGFMEVTKGEKAWVITGVTYKDLSQVPKTIIAIEKVIKKYHPVEFDGWVTVRFVD